MIEYWWLFLLLILVFVLAPLGAAFSEWRALGAKRAVALAPDGHPATENVVADFVWIGMLLALFVIVMQFRLNT